MPPPSGHSSRSKLVGQSLFVSKACGGPIKAPVDTNQITAVLDAGTGAAAWLSEVSAILPSNTELWGVDITDSKFPTAEEEPRLKLQVLDLMSPMPDEFVGKFDLINVRHVVGWVDTAKTDELMGNLMKALKPRGYIQIFDTRMNLEEDFAAYSKGMKKYVAITSKIFGLYEHTSEVILRRRIIPELPARLTKLGYINASQTSYPLPYGKLQEDPEERDKGIIQMFNQPRGFQKMGFGKKGDGEERLSVVVEGVTYYVPGNDAEWDNFFEESDEASRSEGWGLPVHVTVAQCPEFY